MFNQFLAWMVYLGVVFGILWIGWNEPLRYRFLSPEELAQERGLTQGPQRGSAPPNMRDLPAAASASWRPAGTSLDRAAYDVKNGSITYSANYDPRHVGTPTETDSVNNKTHVGPAAP